MDYERSKVRGEDRREWTGEVYTADGEICRVMDAEERGRESKERKR